MQAQEGVAKFAFQMGQGLIKQVIAVDRSGADIFQLGPQIENFHHRHQQQAASFVAGEMRTATTTQRLPQFRDGQVCTSNKQRRSTNFLQGCQQTLGAHRLEQIIDGVQFEGLHGVVIVGGGKNQRRGLRHTT